MAKSREMLRPETDQEAGKLAEQDRKRGKSPSTQAGHFVHEEIEHAKKGRHTVRSAKQAVAIGLSKARRYGIPLKPRSRSKRAA